MLDRTLNILYSILFYIIHSGGHLQQQATYTGYGSPGPGGPTPQQQVVQAQQQRVNMFGGPPGTNQVGPLPPGLQQGPPQQQGKWFLLYYLMSGVMKLSVNGLWLGSTYVLSIFKALFVCYNFIMYNHYNMYSKFEHSIS